MLCLDAWKLEFQLIFTKNTVHFDIGFHFICLEIIWRLFVFENLIWFSMKYAHEFIPCLPLKSTWRAHICDCKIILHFPVSNTNRLKKRLCYFEFRLHKQMSIFIQKVKFNENFKEIPKFWALQFHGNLRNWFHKCCITSKYSNLFWCEIFLYCILSCGIHRWNKLKLFHIWYPIQRRYDKFSVEKSQRIK